MILKIIIGVILDVLIGAWCISAAIYDYNDGKLFRCGLELMGSVLMAVDIFRIGLFMR